MLTADYDHGQEPHDRAERSGRSGPVDQTRLLTAAEPISPRYRLRRCGGRVGGAAGKPIPTSDRFASTLPPVTGDFVVGVIDAGVVRQGGSPHPFFGRHIEFDEASVNPIPNSAGNLCPDDGHGTFVAGLILQEAPSAIVRMIRGIDITGLQNDDATVAAAIDTLAADPRVKVINLSFSGDEKESAPPAGIGEALARLRGRDIVVVAAAGNNSTYQEVWPGAFKEVIAVGAVDETPDWLQGKLPPKASFSSYGPWVEAYASGVGVLGPFLNFVGPHSDQNFAGWARWSGTSFASAIVSGQIARRAIANGASAPVAVASQALLQEGPRFETQDFAAGGLPTYIQGVASQWSLSPLAKIDGCT